MKKERKKGYTLIELVAVMAILIILLGSGFTVVNMLNNIKNEVELESSVYEVNNILSYAKAYCRKNFHEGEIVIDTVKNSIIFQYKAEGNRKILVKSEKFPGNTKISAPKINMNIINISNMGYLKNAGTILISSGIKQKKITIAVGNDFITTKDEEKIDEITNN